MNLYGYQRSNPLIHSDPSGTFLPALALVALPVLKATAVGAAIGGLAGGLIEALFVPNGSFWHGASVGAISGAAGGFGMSAFALSASGFLGTIAGKMIAGGIDGGLSAFAGSYYDNRDFSMAFADAAAGAAIGAATGGILHKAGAWACFEEGTLVVMADGTMVPIEQLQLTERVMSRPDGQGLASSVVDDCSFNQPWFEIFLKHRKSFDSCVDIRLIRSKCWVEDANAEPGCLLDMNIPELNIRGPAEVITINLLDAWDPMTLKAGIVTGLFRTTNANIIDLSVVEMSEPVGTTTSHPFWSLGPKAWIAAGELRAGDSLLTYNGEVTVKGVRLRDDKQTVYNIEVFSDHTYFVSSEHIWVHNGCGPFPGTRSKFEQQNWIYERGRELMQDWGENDRTRRMARDMIEGQIIEGGGDPNTWAQHLKLIFGV